MLNSCCFCSSQVAAFVINMTFAVSTFALPSNYGSAGCNVIAGFISFMDPCSTTVL